MNRSTSNGQELSDFPSTSKEMSMTEKKKGVKRNIHRLYIEIKQHGKLDLGKKLLSYDRQFNKTNVMNKFRSGTGVCGKNESGRKNTEDDKHQEI